MKIDKHAIMTENFDVGCGGWVDMAPTPIYVRNVGGRDDLFVRYSHYDVNGSINDSVHSRQHRHIAYYFLSFNIEELNKI